MTKLIRVSAIVVFVFLLWLGVQFDLQLWQTLSAVEVFQNLLLKNNAVLTSLLVVIILAGMIAFILGKTVLNVVERFEL